MKKIVFIIIIAVLIIVSLLYEQHRKIENEWEEWKEATLDGAKPERPGICFYCDYIKPLIQKNHKQENKPMDKSD